MHAGTLKDAFRIKKNHGFSSETLFTTAFQLFRNFKSLDNRDSMAKNTSNPASFFFASQIPLVICSTTESRISLKTIPDRKYHD